MPRPRTGNPGTPPAAVWECRVTCDWLFIAVIGKDPGAGPNLRRSRRVPSFEGRSRHPWLVDVELREDAALLPRLGDEVLLAEPGRPPAQAFFREAAELWRVEEVADRAYRLRRLTTRPSAPSSRAAPAGPA